jgi:predicted transcriptional regulator
MGMPRFSDDLLSRIDELTDMMEASDKWEVTDEAIAQFLAENGGE